MYYYKLFHRRLVERYQVKLIIYDPVKKVIVTWN